MDRKSRPRWIVYSRPITPSTPPHTLSNSWLYILHTNPLLCSNPPELGKQETHPCFSLCYVVTRSSRFRRSLMVEKTRHLFSKNTRSLMVQNKRTLMFEDLRSIMLEDRQTLMHGDQERGKSPPTLCRPLQLSQLSVPDVDLIEEMYRLYLAFPYKDGCKQFRSVFPAKSILRTSSGANITAGGSTRPTTTRGATTVGATSSTGGNIGSGYVRCPGEENILTLSPRALSRKVHLDSYLETRKVQIHF